jgi:hypothetical protein
LDGAWDAIAPSLAAGFQALISWRGQVFARSVIVAEPGSFEMGLLGRQDFFRVFDVGFEGWRDEPPWMDISSYPPALHLV